MLKMLSSVVRGVTGYSVALAVTVSIINGAPS